MSKIGSQLEEITKTLTNSCSKSEKSYGYATLLHIQEESSDDSSSIQTLAHNTPILISLVLSDVFHESDDEEISAQALKCLGFMIYHPLLVASISVKDTELVLASLVKLITVTKIKSLCNLGVWCISVQQLNVQVLASQFAPLLRAVVHALDNPFASLSTTFEAMQAVIKLGSQLHEEMSNFSSMWAPAIYRRLLSNDKRERDMSERCLLKISSTVFPPTLTLSQTLVEDMKQKLLLRMNDLLKQGSKVQAMQAWGWFVRFLGSSATSKKTRRLINDMLKIPQQTFSENSPQIQISTLVAWECLIDALIQPSLLACKTNEGTYIDIQANGLSKSIKLIMTPLIGIMSSKCDVSVHSRCLKTWCYLLHKLDSSVSCPQIVSLVLEPMFEAIFQTVPDSANLWLRQFCQDLLNDFALAKCQFMDATSTSKPSFSGIYTEMQYAIKWLPWDLNQLDFFMKMMNLIISCSSSHEYTGSAVQIFKSVLKGVQMELKSEEICYDRVMGCLNTILSFIKRICGDQGFLYGSFQFIEAVVEELKPSLLGSLLYKLPLDLEYLQSVHEIEQAKIEGVNSIVYMDEVSPVVYLMAIYIHVLVQSTSPETDSAQKGTSIFFKFIFSSYDPIEYLQVVTGLLYKHVEFRHLHLWIAVAKGLTDLLLTKINSDKTGHLATYHLLIYPFVVCACTQQKINPVECNGNIILENVIEVWRALYVSISDSESKFGGSLKINFHEYLLEILNRWIDENKITMKVDVNIDICHQDRNTDLNLMSLFASAVICIVENFDKCCGDCTALSNAINNRLKFIARFMQLACMKVGTELTRCLTFNSRLLAALTLFVRGLEFEQNIVSFVEILSSSLCQWLLHVLGTDKSIEYQVQVLWDATLSCFKRSQLSLNSSLLKLQASLLEKSLDHPNTLISEPTITFWNSTYGKQIKLDYPQNLIPVLDKLFRKGKINLQARTTSVLKRCKVTATNNRSIKRVEILKDTEYHFDKMDKLSSSFKRKRMELTEHQKEVRRAQQGKGRDCSGHGPGIRTYTNLDFSQGNDESQEIQNNVAVGKENPIPARPRFNSTYDPWESLVRSPSDVVSVH
ncbi:hypothetical protein ACFE04_002962 [Oxalis oulophora]